MNTIFSKTTWSSWETSFTGGFLTTLLRHPFIESPKEIVIVPNNISTATLYNYEIIKLCNIFIYCGIQNLNQHVFIRSAFGDHPTYRMVHSSDGSIFPIVEMQKGHKELLLNKLKDLVPPIEAFPMLEYYKDYILNSTIGIRIKIKEEDFEQFYDEFHKAMGEGQPESEAIKKALSTLSDEGDGISFEKTFDPERFKEKQFGSYSATDPELLNKVKFISPDAPGITSYTHGDENDPMKVKDHIGTQKVADLLVRKLDISFDPRRDIIKSVKQGKLDPGKIATIMSGQLDVYQRTEENQIVKPFKVVMLGDESGSMDNDENINGFRITRVELQRQYIKAFYTAFSQLMPEDDIFVYGHSGKSSPEVYIYKEPGVTNFEKNLEYMKARCENYDGPALEKLYDRIRSFTKDPILFIYFSDGSPAGDGYGGELAEKDLKRVSEKCKRDDFVIVGLSIGARDMKNMYHFYTNIGSVIEPAIKTINQAIKQVFC